MTCEDCLHYEACGNLIEKFNPEYKGKKITLTSKCERFKNRFDYIKVIRCKECGNGYHKNDITVMCKVWDKLVSPEDFCSYGGAEEG